MAQPTLIIIEVKSLNSRELKQLTKKTYVEIDSNADKYFCVTAHKAKKQFPEFYVEIIPHCQRITTADGVEVFVAGKKRHLIATESNLYRFFKDSGAIDETYTDITAYGGEKFKKLCYINWCADSYEKCTEYRIPKVRKNHRLFYVAT